MANPASDTIYSIPRPLLAWVASSRHSGWYPDRVLLTLPQALTGYNEALVREGGGARQHEDRQPGATSSTSTYRDLEHYLVKSAGYARAWADQRTARGK